MYTYWHVYQQMNIHNHTKKKGGPGRTPCTAPLGALSDHRLRQSSSRHISHPDGAKVGSGARTKQDLVRALPQTGWGSSHPNALCLGSQKGGLTLSHIEIAEFCMVGMRREMFSPIFQTNRPSGEEAQVSGMELLSPPALQDRDTGPWQRGLGCG